MDPSRRSLLAWALGLPVVAAAAVAKSVSPPPARVVNVSQAYHFHEAHDDPDRIRVAVRDGFREAISPAFRPNNDGGAYRIYLVDGVPQYAQNKG